MLDDQKAKDLLEELDGLHGGALRAGLRKMVKDEADVANLPKTIKAALEEQIQFLTDESKWRARPPAIIVAKGLRSMAKHLGRDDAFGGAIDRIGRAFDWTGGRIADKVERGDEAEDYAGLVDDIDAQIAHCTGRADMDDALKDALTMKGKLMQRRMDAILPVGGDQ